MRTLRSHMKDLGITVTEVSGMDYDVDDDSWEHHWWDVQLANREGVTMTVTWRQGVGITTTPEDTPDHVFDSLLRDAWGYLATDSFEAWCSEYGYSTDSRRMYAAWETCGKQAYQLLELIGGQHVLDALINDYEPI